MLNKKNIIILQEYAKHYRATIFVKYTDETHFFSNIILSMYKMFYIATNNPIIICGCNIIINCRIISSKAFNGDFL